MLNAVTGKKEFSPIFILENNQPKRVMVKILETDGKNTTIESKDLKEADEVIISQKSENGALRFKPKVQTEQQKASTMNFVQPPRTPQGTNMPRETGKKEFSPIFILENNQPKRVMVKILETDGKNTTIESKDLKENDEVIISQKSENAK